MAEVVEAWKILVRHGLLALFPRRKGGSNTAGIGNILAQGEPSIYMERLAVVALDCEFRIFVDEAFSAFLKLGHSRIGPPVGIVTILVEMTARVIKGVTQFVARNGTEGTVAHVSWKLVREERRLHDTSRENNFIANL